MCFIPLIDKPNPDHPSHRIITMSVIWDDDKLLHATRFNATHVDGRFSLPVMFGSSFNQNANHPAAIDTAIWINR
jgi:hypothetical protein